MGIRERLDALQPRERKLLNAAVGAFVLIVVVLLPTVLQATLSSKRGDNEQLREVIDSLLADRDQIQERQGKSQAVLARYQNPAPPLASFLDGLAKQLELDIPEFKDRPAVPQGKGYEEQATEIRVKKVNMRPLILFLEKIAQSPHPISITKLNIRKRGGAPDEWDASMTVSAYHRTAVDKPKKSEAEAEEPGADEQEAE